MPLYARKDENGVFWVGLEPTNKEVQGFRDGVILRFSDTNTNTGFRIEMAHDAFAEYVTALVKVRETIEAKQEYEGEEGGR